MINGVRNVFRDKFGADAILNHQGDITDEILSKAEQRRDFWAQEVQRRGAFNDIVRETRKYKVQVVELQQQDRVRRQLAIEASRNHKALASAQIGHARKLSASARKANQELGLQADYEQYLLGGS